MKRWLAIALLTGAAFAQGGTTSSNIYPATTGQQLGKTNQRWSIMAQDLDIRGALTCSGLPCSGLAVTSIDVTGADIAPNSVITNSVTLPGATIDATGYHANTGLNASTVSSGSEMVCVAGGRYCTHYVEAYPTGACNSGDMFFLVVSPYGQKQCQNGELTALTTAEPPVVPTCQANNYYISPTGDDAANGDCEHPWKSLSASRVLFGPGVTVHVASGTYTLTSQWIILRSGSAGSPLKFVSDTRGAAKVVRTSSTDSWDTIVTITGDYVELKGFDISSSGTTTLNMGIDMQGSYGVVRNNIVHDLPAPGPAGIGGCGICSTVLTSSHNTSDGNLVYNIGTLNPTTIANRVHGIYPSSPDFTATNNIIHHVRDWGIQLGHAATRASVINNTIFSNGNGGIMVSLAAADLTSAGITPPGHDLRIQNNVVFHNGISPNANGYGVQEYNTYGAGSLTTPNYYLTNVVYDNLPGNWKLNVTQHGNETAVPSGNITQLPDFINWKIDGSGDYNPLTTGNLVGSGTTANQPTTNYMGITRNSPANIGAY